MSRDEALQRWTPQELADELRAIFCDPEGNPCFIGSIGDHAEFMSVLHRLESPDTFLSTSAPENAAGQENKAGAASAGADSNATDSQSRRLPNNPAPSAPSGISLRAVAEKCAEIVEQESEQYEDTSFSAAQAIRTYAASLPETPAIPQGMVLVPVEPTPEMVERGVNERIRPLPTAGHSCEAIYRAMLAAAPDGKE